MTDRRPHPSRGSATLAIAALFAAMLNAAALHAFALFAPALRAAEPAYPSYVPPAAAAVLPALQVEHRGNASRAGPALARTCEQMCQPPLSAKRCTIEGDPQRHGDFVAQVYRSADAMLRWTRGWALVQQGGDVCSLRLLPTQSVRLVLYQGGRSTLYDADLERGTGTRRTVVGRVPELALETEPGIAALRADGYAPAGGARVGGYGCVLWRKRAGELEFDTCLLADTALPPRFGDIVLQGMPLSSSMQGRDPASRTFSAVHSLQIGSAVPAAMFEPPPGIAWKEHR